MMRHSPSSVAWAAAAIVVAGFSATVAVARFNPGSLSRMAVVMAVAIPVLTAALCMKVSRHAGRVVSAALAVTPTFLVAGAYGFFLVVGNDAARAAVLAVAAVLVGFYFTYLVGLQTHDARFQKEDFLDLSFVIHVLTMFFVLAATFGISGFSYLPTPVIAVCVAVVALLASVETFRRAGVLASGAAFAFAFAFVAAEFVVALSFLPTSGLVNATVGAVLYAAGLRIATWTLIGRADVRTSRRQVALSFFLVLLVFSTARWN
jgi:hypothetical protein